MKPAFGGKVSNVVFENITIEDHQTDRPLIILDNGKHNKGDGPVGTGAASSITNMFFRNINAIASKDPNVDILLYELTDNEGGEFTNINFDNVRINNELVRADSDRFVIASGNPDIKVNGAPYGGNLPPYFTSDMSDSTIPWSYLVGQSIPITATDINSSDIVGIRMINKPSWINTSLSSGHMATLTLTFNSSVSPVRTEPYEIIFEAYDNNGGVTDEIIHVTIIDPYVAPTITSTNNNNNSITVNWSINPTNIPNYFRIIKVGPWDFDWFTDSPDIPMSAFDWDYVDGSERSHIFELDNPRDGDMYVFIAESMADDDFDAYRESSEAVWQVYLNDDTPTPPIPTLCIDKNQDGTCDIFGNEGENKNDLNGRYDVKWDIDSSYANNKNIVYVVVELDPNFSVDGKPNIMGFVKNDDGQSITINNSNNPNGRYIYFVMAWLGHPSLGGLSSPLDDSIWQIPYIQYIDVAK